MCYVISIINSKKNYNNVMDNSNIFHAIDTNVYRIRMCMQIDYDHATFMLLNN